MFNYKRICRSSQRSKLSEQTLNEAKWLRSQSYQYFRMKRQIRRQWPRIYLISGNNLISEVWRFGVKDESDFISASFRVLYFLALIPMHLSSIIFAFMHSSILAFLWQLFIFSALMRRFRTCIRSGNEHHSFHFQPLWPFYSVVLQFWFRPPDGIYTPLPWLGRFWCLPGISLNLRNLPVLRWNLSWKHYFFLQRRCTWRKRKCDILFLNVKHRAVPLSERSEGGYPWPFILLFIWHPYVIIFEIELSLYNFIYFVKIYLICFGGTEWCLFLLNIFIKN